MAGPARGTRRGCGGAGSGGLPGLAARHAGRPERRPYRHHPHADGVHLPWRPLAGPRAGAGARLPRPARQPAAAPGGDRGRLGALGDARADGRPLARARDHPRLLRLPPRALCHDLSGAGQPGAQRAHRRPGGRRRHGLPPRRTRPRPWRLVAAQPHLPGTARTCRRCSSSRAWQPALARAGASPRSARAPARCPARACAGARRSGGATHANSSARACAGVRRPTPACARQPAGLAAGLASSTMGWPMPRCAATARPWSTSSAGPRRRGRTTPRPSITCPSWWRSAPPVPSARGRAPINRSFTYGSLSMARCLRLRREVAGAP